MKSTTTFTSGLSKYTVYLNNIRGKHALTKVESATVFDASRMAQHKVYKMHGEELETVLVFEGWPNEVSDQIRLDKR